jgi:hypothetical protein
VHLDMRHEKVDIGITRIFNNLVRAHRLLVRTLPPSRRCNEYCEPNPSPALADNFGDRYRHINAEALRTHRTIEVRSHAGTLNAGKIIKWVLILHRIAKRQDWSLRAPETIARLAKRAKFGKYLERYLNQRLVRFSQGTTETVEDENGGSANV